MPNVEYLEFEHQVHPVTSEWINITEDQRNNDVYTITLMLRNSILKHKNTHKLNKSCASKHDGW